MSKRGKVGRSRWIISEWIDIDSEDTWLTIIAVVGWILFLVLAIGFG
jgi:hypothetical protein